MLCTHNKIRWRRCIRIIKIKVFNPTPESHVSNALLTKSAASYVLCCIVRAPGPFDRRAYYMFAMVCFPRRGWEKLKYRPSEAASNIVFHFWTLVFVSLMFILVILFFSFFLFCSVLKRSNTRKWDGTTRPKNNWEWLCPVSNMSSTGYLLYSSGSPFQEDRVSGLRWPSISLSALQSAWPHIQTHIGTSGHAFIGHPSQSIRYACHDEDGHPGSKWKLLREPKRWPKNSIDWIRCVCLCVLVTPIWHCPWPIATTVCWRHHRHLVSSTICIYSFFS